MAEFKIGDRFYTARKMDARTQFHVARKLMPAVGPFLKAVGPVVDVFAASKDASALDQSRLFANLEPLMRVIADLPADDCDFVLDKCLAVVSRKDPRDAGWAPIWNTDVKRMMFDDIDMPTMLAIAGHVIKDNLASFSSALPSLFNGVR